MKTHREEKRKKLKSRLIFFVEQYRGIYHPETKVWFRKPKPQFKMKIRDTLEKLVDTSYELDCALEFIEKCQSYDKFYKYVAAEKWDEIGSPETEASGIQQTPLLETAGDIQNAKSELAGQATEVRAA